MRNVSKNDLEIAACTIRTEKLRQGIHISHCQAQQEAAKSLGARSWQEAIACSAPNGADNVHPAKAEPSQEVPAEIQLPELLVGYYSYQQYEREAGYTSRGNENEAKEHLSRGPEASESDLILMKRARQRGRLLAAASTPIKSYSSSGVPTELYRLHSELNEYRKKVVVHAIWQPVVSGEPRAKIYVAAWSPSSDWREGLDVWFGLHGTAEALEELLSDLDRPPNAPGSQA